MNVAPSHPSRATSRLLERLRSLAGQPGGGRVGFRSAAAPSKRRLAVIAQIAGPDVATARAAAVAGADAVEVQFGAGAAPSTLAGLSQEIGVPVGLAAAGAAGEDFARAASEAELDWLRVALDTPVEALAWERPARYLTVPTGIDLRLATGLAAPLAEAVAFVGQEEMSELRIGDALRIRLLAEIAKKPVLLQVPGSGSPIGASILSSFGVDAVLLPIAGASDVARIADYLRTFEQATSSQG